MLNLIIVVHCCLGGRRGVVGGALVAAPLAVGLANSDRRLSVRPLVVVVVVPSKAPLRLSRDWPSRLRMDRRLLPPKGNREVEAGAATGIL
jgi:hypothetical protein